MLADDPTATKLLLKDPALLFAPLGMTYRGGDSLSLDTEIGNPLGGPPLPVRGSIRMASYNGSASVATIETLMSLDPEKSPAAVRETFTRLMSGPLAPAPGEAMPEIKLTMQDRAEHVVDVTTGWPSKVRHRRIIRTGDRQRMDGLWMDATVRPGAAVGGSGATAGAR
jgi:hypothetical protein